MHPGWKRAGVIAVALAAVVLFVAREERLAPEDPPAEEPGDVRVPLPDLPPRKPLAELARGIYELSTERLHVSLVLDTGRRFRFLSRLAGKGDRKAEGTWRLSGRKLTMAYTRIAGKPAVTPQNPYVVTNQWNGRTIELMQTGLSGRVILRKKTVIRKR